MERAKEERVAVTRSSLAPPPAAVEQSSMLPYYGYRVAEAIVSAVPRPVANVLASTCADAVRIVRPRTLDGLRANLRRVMPDADQRTLRTAVRRNVRNLARCWVDVMELSHRPEKVRGSLSTRDLAHYTTAVDRGRGVVVVSLHLGAWERGLAAWNAGRGELALLAESLKPVQLFDRVADARRALGVHIVPLDAEAMRSGDAATKRRLGAHAMREVMRRLRSGGTIAIAIDRDITGTGVAMPFFGAAASIPTGVVDVAIRSGAAIVPIVLPRTRRSTRAICFPEVAYDSRAPREQEVARVAAEILRIFETVIRAVPEQWHVLDPIWKDSAAGVGR